jgi:hypothetical protein
MSNQATERGRFVGTVVVGHDQRPHDQNAINGETTKPGVVSPFMAFSCRQSWLGFAAAHRIKLPNPKEELTT